MVAGIGSRPIDRTHMRRTQSDSRHPQLRAVTFREHPADRYPFSTPVIQGLLGHQLAFRSAVTILAGENGSGKSTLLEAIACAVDAVAVGSHEVSRDTSLDAGRALAEIMTPVWDAGRAARRGFFLRAEDFFGYALRIDRLRTELAAQRAELLADLTLSGTARAHALQPIERELASLRGLYGSGLETRSHGEAFLELFRSRLVPGGLYLLDEPEAPLSPTRQLTLLSMLMTIVREENAQVIMATHSPIMMAFPGATLLHLTGGGIESASFDDIEHISVMRSFLADPDAYLRHL
jgi:predicted ATPase